MSVSLVKASVTVGVLSFLAYCVYFDRKRRNDSNFKSKLKESKVILVIFKFSFVTLIFSHSPERQKEKKTGNGTEASEIPVFKDPTEMQAYFLQEVQLSDDLMQAGTILFNRLFSY